MKNILDDSVYYGITMTDGLHARLEACIKRINVLIGQTKQPVNQAELTDFTIRKRNGELLEQSLLLYTVRNSTFKLSIARDSMMAANIEWVVQNKFRSGPVFVWAHNDHIGNISDHRYKNMGAHLRKHFGKRYYILGIDFITGSVTAKNLQKGSDHRYSACLIKEQRKKSLNAHIAALNSGLVFFNLCAACNDAAMVNSPLLKKDAFIHSIGAEYYGSKYLYEDIHPLDEFDGLLFFSHSSPTRFVEGVHR